MKKYICALILTTISCGQKSIHDEPPKVDEDKNYLCLANQCEKGLLTDTWYKHYKSNRSSGVDIYVIDTGFHLDHPELSELNIKKSYTAHNNKANNLNSCRSHGDSILSIISGKNIGVLSKVPITTITLEHCTNGSWSFDNLLKSFDLVIRDFDQRGLDRAVVNMSLGQSKKTLLGEQALKLEAKIQNLLERNIFLVMAAGNNSSGFLGSPYIKDHYPTYLNELGGVIAVGGFNKDLTKSSYTSLGTRFFAPGQEQLIAKTIGNDHVYTLGSATSFSAPFVTAHAAKFLLEKNFTPNEMKRYLYQHAQKKIFFEDNTSFEAYLLSPFSID